MDTMDLMPPSATDLLDDETRAAIEKSVQDAIKAQVDFITKPIYPRWYKESDYPKPEPGAAYSHVIDIEAQFGPLRNQIADDLKKLSYATIAVYKGFDEQNDEAWADSAIVAEMELSASQLAEAEITYIAPAVTMADEDEAERKVEFAHACINDAERQHIASGNGPFRLEKARTLLNSGRIAWHATLNLDPDEGEMPFNEVLLDPATCYPVYDTRGMRSMSRRYSTTIAEVVSAFSTPGNDLSYLLDDRGKDGRFQKPRKPTDITVVSEFWDRRWRIVWMDGDVILGPVEHGFAYVPFVYGMGGLGLPVYQKDPNSLGERYAGNVTVGVSYNPRDVSHPNKGISLIRLLRAPHDLREVVMAKMLNAFDTSYHPAMTMEMDDFAFVDGVPEINLAKGQINPLKMGRHRLSAIPTDPSPQLMGPILNGVAENMGKLTQPPAAHGQNDKSNVAGYAINSQGDTGQIKILPHKLALEAFEQQCMELRFRMYRDHGHLVQQGEHGRQGELTVPMTDMEPGGPRAFLLTPGDLRRTGIKIKVSMSNISVQMLGPVGNAVNQLIKDNLMTQERGLRILGDPNPQKTIRRIRYDNILNNPQIQALEIYEGLKEQGMHEAAEMFIQMSGGAANGGGAAPPMNEMEGSPVTATVGDSNAQYGFGPGPGSGPQGPVGPRLPSGPLGVME